LIKLRMIKIGVHQSKLLASTNSQTDYFQADAEGAIENLQGCALRYAIDPEGPNQRGSARIHQNLKHHSFEEDNYIGHLHNNSHAHQFCRNFYWLGRLVCSPPDASMAG